MRKTMFLTYVALSTLAIGQPVLDLYGRNLTIFSAGKMNALSTALFGLFVIAFPALVAWVVDLFSRLFGPVVHASTQLMLMRSFLFLFVLALLNTWKVREDFVAYPLALAAAYLIGRALDRSDSVRSWLQWLRILPLVVAVVFALQAQPIFFPAPVKVANATIQHRDIPVLQVIFDEFPLYSVLDSDGNVNAERFPGLATLQREGTWYRNSAAVSNFTHQAVPAILTSSIPSRTSTPLFSSHRKNVFTLLGGVMPVDGFEPVTSLCPVVLCENAQKERSTFDLGKFGNFVKDAVAVYARRIAPDRTAEHLPQTDAGWGGFDVVANRFKGQWSQGNLAQQDNLVKGARNIANSSVSRYQLVHALMPHAPWYVTPDDRVTTIRRKIDTTNPAGEDATRDVYQRFLYQAVASDGALLDAINVLKDAGKWNETLVIFTADHGISFVPDGRQRTTDLTNSEMIDDVYRVPTFIKYPGQTKGTVSDCAISNLDLLPTIVDVLGINSDWTFGGMSLARGCPDRDSRPIEAASGQKGVLAGGFDKTMLRSAYYASKVSPDGAPREIAAVGSSARLIGTTLKDLPKSTISVRWTLADVDLLQNVSSQSGSQVPAVMRGGVLLQTPLPAGTEGILLIDDVAAGVIGEFSLGSTYFGYTAIVDYTLLTPGKHVVTLAIRDGVTGKISLVGAPTAS